MRFKENEEVERPNFRFLDEPGLSNRCRGARYDVDCDETSKAGLNAAIPALRSFLVGFLVRCVLKKGTAKKGSRRRLAAQDQKSTGSRHPFWKFHSR